MLEVLTAVDWLVDVLTAVEDVTGLEVLTALDVLTAVEVVTGLEVLTPVDAFTGLEVPSSAQPTASRAAQATMLIEAVLMGP